MSRIPIQFFRDLLNFLNLQDQKIEVECHNLKRPIPSINIGNLSDWCFILRIPMAPVCLNDRTPFNAEFKKGTSSRRTITVVNVVGSSTAAWPGIQTHNRPIAGLVCHRRWTPPCHCVWFTTISYFLARDEEKIPSPLISLLPEFPMPLGN